MIGWVIKVGWYLKNRFQPFEYQTISSVFRCYLIQMPDIVRYSSYGLNKEPFNDQTTFDHLNIKLVRYLDPTLKHLFLNVRPYLVVWVECQSNQELLVFIGNDLLTWNCTLRGFYTEKYFFNRFHFIFPILIVWWRAW